MVRAIVRLVLVTLFISTFMSTHAARAQAQASASPPQAAAPSGPRLPRWDVAGMLGWRGVRLEDESTYDRSSHRFVYSGTVGFYWTPNIRAEGEIGGMVSNGYQRYRPANVPGLQYGAFIRSEHSAIGLPLAGRLLYQFGENAWFHPFVGAGISYDRERDRVRTPLQTAPGNRRPDGTFEQIVIANEDEHTETHDATHAAVMVGFKAYATERAFLRTDVQWTPGSARDRYTSWRIGMGMDF